MPELSGVKKTRPEFLASPCPTCLILNGFSKEEAVNEAVNFAIKNDFLDGFFKLQKSEVLNMNLTEFDQEAYDRHRYREGRQDGIAETAKNFLKKNIPAETIAECTGLSLEEVNRLKESLC